MSRATQIQTEYGDAIEEAVGRFGDHEDITAGRVTRWLAQFEDPDLPLAVQVIRAIRYFNAINIRTMTKQLLEISIDELNQRNLLRAAFVAVGSLGAGSGTVARILRDRLKSTRHRMLSMLEVASLKRGAVDAIIFIDDFSGSGQTLEKWWENVEPIVRPTNAQVFVGLLVVNERAHERIRAFAEVFAVEELAASANVLSPENSTFTDEEKPRVFEYCQRTGCGEKYEAGWGQCGLLLAFKHGCPNNSLPILWVHEGQWRSLFNRRAI